MGAGNVIHPHNCTRTRGINCSSGQVSELLPALLSGFEASQMFPCGRCGRQYTRKYNLLRHVRLECGKEPQHQCPHCPHRAKRKNNLKVHIVTKHPEQCVDTA
ncbi:hypothetical protein J6590_014857 [Homalodisca vitripennis]|nr:hypothetical protein J6590_014857 [Homalodisca vitripennis]